MSATYPRIELIQDSTIENDTIKSGTKGQVIGRHPKSQDWLVKFDRRTWPRSVPTNICKTI